MPKFRSLTILLVSGLLQIMSLSAQSSWTELSPPSPLPAARYLPTAAYNPVSNRLIVFGGSTGLTYVNDVWVMTNANGIGQSSWIQLIPNGAPASPIGRILHTAVYDAANNRLIVFGGLTFDLAELNDVWVLTNADGTGGTPQWIQLTTSGVTPPRANHGAVYDSASNRMIIFLGDTTGYRFANEATDVWALTNANGLGGTPAWIQLSPEGNPPPGRWVNPIDSAYDPTSNRLIVYGGVRGIPNSRSTYGDTWVLTNANGLSGTPVWQQLNPTGSIPITRVGASGFYDSSTNRLVIYGGTSDPGDYPVLSDTWVLSNANGIGIPFWQQISTTGTQIPGREFHGAVYDKFRHLMIVYGGQVPDKPLFVLVSETWVLSNANGIGSICSYKISPVSAKFSAEGGMGSAIVSASSGCPWQASSNVPWATITSVGQNKFRDKLGDVVVGNNVVAYTVSSNSGTERSGTLTIAGQPFTVTQSGIVACSISRTPASQGFTAAGGSGQFQVTAGPGCRWNAFSTVPWVSITSGTSGVGNAGISFSVARNNGPDRSGTIMINGLSYTISQVAAPPSVFCGATEVTNQVAFYGSAYMAGFLGQYWTQQISVVNVGSQTISGPLFLVFQGLPRFDQALRCQYGCSVQAPSFNTSCPSAPGAPVVYLGNLLGPHQVFTTTIVLLPGLVNPYSAFHYTPHIVSGVPQL